jgi:hypothetical protein
MEETKKATLSLNKIKDAVACSCIPRISSEKPHHRRRNRCGNEVEDGLLTRIVDGTSDQNEVLQGAIVLGRQGLKGLR